MTQNTAGIRPLFLILIIFGFYAFSPSDTDGLYEQYFKKHLLTKGQIIDGNKSGEWQFFYPDQSIHFKGRFTNGKKSGTWLFYNHKGKLFTKAEFANNEISNAKAFYKNGTLIAKEHFNNGLFTGKTDYYYENGNVQATLIEKKNRSILSSFHANGNLKFITVEWKNKRNDTTKVYYSNGQIKEELSFY
ncbi:MAG: toxin-antitoxin system YwqK family antitoxin, partial [Bacteroidia bacterium]